MLFHINSKFDILGKDFLDWVEDRPATSMPPEDFRNSLPSILIDATILSQRDADTGFPSKMPD